MFCANAAMGFIYMVVECVCGTLDSFLHVMLTFIALLPSMSLKHAWFYFHGS